MDPVEANEERLEWSFEFDDEFDGGHKFERIGKRTHCVLIYDDDECGEMRWEIKEGEKLYLGRSNGIGIRDKRLSRHQVECHVDFDEMKVVVTRVGKHSSLDQQFQPIGLGCTIELDHLDTFWLLKEKYPIYIFLEMDGPRGQANYVCPSDHEENQDDSFKDDSSESDESGICSEDD